jgi:DNA-directed RNA polymerase subunit RPC12/RpoP
MSEPFKLLDTGRLDPVVMKSVNCTHTIVIPCHCKEHPPKNEGELCSCPIPNYLEEFEAEWAEKKKLEDIWCPYCDHKQDYELRSSFVSYWGESGEEKCSCEECGEEFLVEEHVERSFTCKKRPE